MLLLGAVPVAPAEVPAHGSLLQGSRPAHLWLTVTEILGVKSPGRETWLTHRCGQSLLSPPQRRMGWSCRCTGHSEPHSALPGWREGRGSPDPQTRTCYPVRETQRKVFAGKSLTELLPVPGECAVPSAGTRCRCQVASLAPSCVSPRRARAGAASCLAALSASAGFPLSWN